MQLYAFGHDANPRYTKSGGSGGWRWGRTEIQLGVLDGRGSASWSGGRRVKVVGRVGGFASCVGSLQAKSKSFLFFHTSSNPVFVLSLTRTHLSRATSPILSSAPATFSAYENAFVRSGSVRF